MAFQGLNLNQTGSNDNYQNIPQDIDNINQIFEPYGLIVNDVRESSQVVRYVLDLPLDITTNQRLMRSKKAIESTLSVALKSDNISYYQIEDKIVIERKGTFNIIPFGSLYTNEFHSTSSMTSVALAQDLNGKPIYIDIAKAPHVLVAGRTGSGKSETIHAILASLLMHNTYLRGNEPYIVRTSIHIIDMKGTEYIKYKNTNISIISNELDAFTLLSNLCIEMENRYAFLAQYGCDDIDEYISRGYNLSREVCIIDEFADLILKNRTVEEYVVRLAQKARGCGIHLVIGTQSPRREVITGLIKANVPLKIALNTTNAMESRIILDEMGAEKLYGKGDMLIKIGGDKPIRAQGCFVSDADKMGIANVVAMSLQY